VRFSYGRTTATAVVAALLLAACRTVPPSVSERPPSSAAVSPTPAIASPTSSQAHAPYPVVSIGGLPIKSVSLPAGSPQIHRLAGYGPRVVFDEVGYGGDLHQGQTIWLADVEAGTLTKLTTTDGDAAWMPVFRGDFVAWVEWHYANAHALTGALTWQIKVHDLSTNRATTVRSGVSPAVDGAGGIPLLALTDRTLIVAFPSPRTGNERRWQIDHIALATGEVTKVLDSPEWIYSLAGSDELTAFTTGKRDAQANFIFDTRLMVASASDKTPHGIARDSFEVAVDAARVVWVDDRAASQAPSPAAVAPRIYAANAPEFVPAPISPPPNREPIVGSAWPAAGDGLVTWTDNHDAPPRFPDANGDHLVLWSDARGAVELEPTAGMILSAVGNGWITWYNDWQPTLFLYGLRESDVQHGE
jgi:hypothetical protein